MTQRQQVMRLLALAPEELLEAAYSGAPADWAAHSFIRVPEAGLLMVRGRISNTGSPFNVGEIIVTRCVVALESGESGYAWIAGEKKRHAELAAVFDALWQKPDCAAGLEKSLRPALEAAVTRRAAARAGKTAPTRVDFFTLVRGED